MNEAQRDDLSRRQEEIRNILFRLGEASIADIMGGLSDSPTSGAVRRMVNILYEKGIVDYRHDGARKIYFLKAEKSGVRECALRHVVDTFFAGSAARAMAALLGEKGQGLSVDERALLLSLIEKAKGGGR